jgi:hypothetical protein
MTKLYCPKYTLTACDPLGVPLLPVPEGAGVGVELPE